MQSTEVCGIFLKIKYQFQAHSQAVCIQPAERRGMINNLSFRYINEVVSDVFKQIWLSALMKWKMMIGVNSHAESTQEMML